MLRPHIVSSYLILAAFLGSCVSIPNSDQRAPVGRLASQSTWVTDRGGYIYRIGYFTEAELRDPRWEAARLETMNTGRFCEGLGGGQIVRRQVRRYDATAVSGQRCAAVIYTLHCRHPTQRPDDGLERARINLLRQDPSTPIEPRCGEKNPALRPQQAFRPFPPLAETETSSVQCSREEDVADRIRVSPRTRIYIRTIENQTITHARDLGPRYTEIPFIGVERAFRQASRIHPIRSFQPVPDDGVNIIITQEFAVRPDGEPYCVRLTARQGNRTWRRQVVRNLLPDRLDQEVGTDVRGFSNDPSRYWTPITDARVLALSLGNFLVAHASPDQTFRRGW